MLGGSRLQVPAIEAAQRLGFRVVCADYDPDAVGFKVADVSSLTSTLDVEAVEALAREEQADFVITSTSDAPVSMRHAKGCHAEKARRSRSAHARVRSVQQR